MAQVIDLRKPGNEKRPPSVSAPTPPRGRGSDPPRRIVGGVGAAKKPVAVIEWRAREYETREHGPYWFIGTGAVATALIILGILAKSYFFIAFVALAYLTLVLYAKRPPRELTFAVTPDGVEAGRKFYRFSDLKSFWILDTPEGTVLSLETGETLSPYVRLPLGNADPEAIRNRLRDTLPEKEHQEFLTDRIARGLGL